MHFDEDFVFIAQDGARYLAACGVRCVGVDYLSVGGFREDGPETHHALLEAGIWIIEGLNLKNVEPGEYELACLPLRLIGLGRRTRESHSERNHSMKAAAVFPAKKTLAVVNDFPEPKLASPTGVKVRVLNVGVCGTDREIASFQYGFPPPAGSEFLVMGHECLGEVVEAGPEVQNFKPGDLVDSDGATALRSSRMHRVPGRPAGLLLHRRLPRTRHQTDARLSHRDDRRRSALHESRAAGDSRCCGARRASHDRGERADSGTGDSETAAVGSERSAPRGCAGRGTRRPARRDGPSPRPGLRSRSIRAAANRILRPIS